MRLTKDEILEELMSESREYERLSHQILDLYGMGDDDKNLKILRDDKARKIGMLHKKLKDIYILEKGVDVTDGNNT